MIKTIFKIAGRCSVWIILMFLVWNITLSNPEQMNVLDWIFLVVLSLLSFIWAHFLPFFEDGMIRVEKMQSEDLRTKK